METYTPILFNVEDDIYWKDYLDKYGFVVIKDVLDDKSYTELLEQFYYDWNTVTPKFNFKDKTTWTYENSPMAWDIGMITGYGLGHSKFQWGLRTQPDILDIWKRLHDTEDLVVSYDGFSVFFSPEQQSDVWLHVDQNPKDTLYSIQGAYNFFPVNEDDAGFIVVPGSHKTFNVDVDECYKFIPADPRDYHVDYAVKLLIPNNCFVLWNSKTLHANTGMSYTKDKEFNRLTSYISYFPKIQRPEHILQKRIYGYHNVVNCGHCAIDYNPKKKTDERFNTILPTYDKNGIIPKFIYELI